jgi:hypothetical protein
MGKVEIRSTSGRNVSAIMAFYEDMRVEMVIGGGFRVGSSGGRVLIRVL